jgi:N-carbamoyl-L-amino-acid hydrolase
MTRNIAASETRIADDLEALAAITEPGRPYTRRAFTPLFADGRKYLERRFREAGLETRIDAAGNLIGRRRGARPERGVIMLGSHSDTVPDGGRFDGVAGVVAALEVARALNERGIVLDHDLEVVDFLAEEVSIFGVSCIGSRGMAGLLPAEWLTRRHGERTLADGMLDVGGDPRQVAARGDVAAFLELHIEQGPVLETAGLDIGVVTAIAGISRIEIMVDGQADHAGTTPMRLRKDALTAAADLALTVQRLARELAEGPAHFAATVGEFSIEPNAANVVPSHARLLLDVRAERRADFEAFSARLNAAVAELAARTGIAIEVPRLVSDNPAAPMDAGVMDVLDGICADLEVGHRRMASGAGHDAAFLSRVGRAGMVFVPCRDGRSHASEEWADTADIALGTAVLVEAVQRLDRKLEG